MLIVEAAAEVGGSWPSYYDSLTLFSPARFSTLPGHAAARPARPLPDPGRDHRLSARLRRPVRPAGPHPQPRRRRRLGRAHLSARPSRRGPADRSGGGRGVRRVRPAPRSRPARPDRLHRDVAARRRLPPAGAVHRPRVVVVGAGNSAVQIAVELAQVATVTLASREPVRFRSQRPLGLDVHYWARWSGLEALPIHRDGARSVGVLDDGRYAAALAAGRPDRRPDVRPAHPDRGRLVRRHRRAGRRGHPRHRLPARRRLPGRPRRPQRRRLADPLPRPQPHRPPARLRRAARPDRAGLGHRPRRRRRRPPHRRLAAPRPQPQPAIRPSRPPAASPPWPTDEPRPRRPHRPHARTDRSARTRAPGCWPRRSAPGCWSAP